MKEYLQFIDGAMIKSDSGETYEVENPYTGSTIALAQKANKADVDMALEAAKKAQVDWAKQPAVARGAVLKQLAEVIRANRVELAKILASEQAKVLPLAQVEVDFTADYFDYYAGWARIYEGEIIQSDRPKENILLFRQPMGVVAGICPWNFPFFVMARKVAPSLLTGSTIVIKPSGITPATTMEFAGHVAGLDIPKGILNIITGGGSVVGDALVRSPTTAMVSLTGSVGAGQKIIEASAENITKCSLELGGKAPAIVCADADLDLAVKAVVSSRVIFSGQVCNCAERLYVEKSVAAEFTTKLVAAMKAVTFGDPFAELVPDMSCQVSEDQLEKIEEAVELAKKEGAEVLCGGKRPDTTTGYFYEPTVLGNCSQDYSCVREEVFGPVLPVLTFDDLDEAIDLANDCQYGLTSSIYTTNINKAFEAINSLKFGETYVNRENFEAMQGYHAGWRKSGIGGADGKHGLYEYLQTHVAYIQY